MRFSRIVLAVLLILAIAATIFACSPGEVPGGGDVTTTTGGGNTTTGGGGKPSGPDQPDKPNPDQPGDDDTPGKVQYTVAGNHCTVSGYTGKLEGTLVIPETVEMNGETYTVTAIADGAFSGCRYITSVVVPDTVTKIGNGAFTGCTALAEIRVPFVGGSAESDTFFGFLFGGASFTENARVVPESLHKVTIGDGCTTIADFAFDGCTSITEVTLGSATTTVGSYAFARCGITSVTLPDTVTSIGIGAYVSCPLAEITLPFVGQDASGSIGYLGHIFGAAKYEDNGRFVPTTLKTLTLSFACSAIGDGAFNDCATLATINLPDTIMAIGRDAFRNTPYYESKGEGIVLVGKVLYGYKGELKETDLVVPDGTVAIASGAIDGLPLRSVTIPASVVNIGAAAFRGSQLTEITLSFIGENATTETNTYLGYIFGAASAEENAAAVPTTLKTVILRDNCATIASRAFYDCLNLTEVRIGSGAVSIDKDAFVGCSRLAAIRLAEGNTAYRLDGGLLYNAAGNDLIAVPGAISGDIVLLPITEIAEGQFSGCTGITSVKLPETLVSIGRNAFRGAALLATFAGGFPDALTTVGYAAFEGTAWYEAQEGMIYTGNVLYKYKGAEGSPASVRDGTTGIAAGAFENCKITSVSIPASVVSIGEGAFAGCELEKMVLPFIGASADDETKGYIGYLFGAPSVVTSVQYVPTTLTTVELLSSCTRIWDSAFAGCQNVSEILVTDSVVYVGNEALHQTKWFSSQPDGVVYVGRVAYSFVSPKLTYEELVAAIKDQVGRELEEGEERLTNVYEVILREDTIMVAPYAFSGKEIVSIRMPDSVKIIGANAFYNCRLLNRVRMPSDLTTLAEYAFSGCTALEKIYLPGTILDVQDYTFQKCGSLRLLYLGKGIRSVGSFAFSGCKSLAIVYNMGDRADWQSLAETMGEGNDFLSKVRLVEHGYDDYTNPDFEGTDW